MTAIDYAALIARFRTEGDGVVSTRQKRMIADALERLTQPSGEAKPVAKSNGVVIIRLDNSPFDVDVWESLYSAQTVAGLIAERAKAEQQRDDLTALLREADAADEAFNERRQLRSPPDDLTTNETKGE